MCLTTAVLYTFYHYNAAARIIVRKRKCDHITASIRDDLHWLPVRQRVEFKLCRLVYKCLHQSAPSYLAAMCVHIYELDGRRHLRSAAHGDLVKPTTRGRTYGQSSFAVAGSSIWNSLPSFLKDYSLAINEFQKSLQPNFLGQHMHYILTVSAS